MQESVLYIVLAIPCVVIFILLNKNNEELGRLKESLTNSINTMPSSFNSLSIE